MLPSALTSLLLTLALAQSSPTRAFAADSLRDHGLPGAQASLRGDSGAVAAIERMLAATGGRDLWVQAHSMHLTYVGQVVTPRAVTDTEVAWRDLRQPNERIEHRGDGIDRVGVFTPSFGWRVRQGSYRPMTELEHDFALTFWARDFYTLLRRFAIRDPDLYVRSVPGQPLRVVVHSRSQGEVGWWEIATDGAIIRWGTVYAGAPLEYVYGPMRSFGRVSFPAWGARLDGGWRFEYTQVELHPTPIPESLLRPPPAR